MPDLRPQHSIIEPDAYAPTLKRLRQIGKLLDNTLTIPGTQIGIGLDPILGTIPIGGDVLGVIFSFYIIIEAVKLGVSKATLGRMIFNVIIDGLFGAVPVMGDFFDFAWTANIYNIQLLEDYLKSPIQKKKADRWFVIAVFCGLVLLGVVLVALPVIIIQFLWHILTGT
jgi:hypothetical protein